jgi:2'-phosphotransferase
MDDSRVSRVLTRVLRHQGPRLGLSMSPDGFARVDDLLKLRELRGATVDSVRRVVDACPKRRFALGRDKDGALLVRATQGHSITSVSDAALLREITTPLALPLAVHGTFSKFLPSILATGLSRMRRNHIHLARHVPGAKELVSGARLDTDVLIFVDVARAMRDGIGFFESDNGVVLTRGDNGVLHPRYFARVARRDVETGALRDVALERDDATASTAAAPADPADPAGTEPPAPPPAPGTKQHRAWVQQDTLQALRVNCAKVDTTHMLLCGAGRATPRYTAIALPEPRDGPDVRVAMTDIAVVEEDTLVCARRVAAAAGPKGGAVAVLDMASYLRPGGGYLDGAAAQEEDLCRRTTLIAALQAAHAAGAYPIPRNGLIYVPSVTVFRHPGPEYAWFDAGEQFDVAVFAVAALRKPQLDAAGNLTPVDARATLTKIELLLAAAAALGHKHLVLGALGCGAYGNPPRHVALLFQDALARFGSWFQSVTFAVVGDGNFPVFRRVFAGS